MKKVHLVLGIIAVFVDYTMLIAAGLAAYAVRYTRIVQDVRPVIFDLSQGYFLGLVLVVALAWIVIFALSGMYTHTYNSRITREFLRIFVGCSLGFLGIITFLFWSRELFSSRFILLVAWIFAIIFVLVGRIILRIIRIQLLKHNIGTTAVVLIGTSTTHQVLQQAIADHLVWEFSVIKAYADFDEVVLSELLKHNHIDAIIMTDPSIDRNTRVAVHDFCIQHHIDFHYTADIFDAQSHNVVMHTFAGVPVVSIKKTKLEGWGRIYKRMFDLVFSLLGIIILGPLMVIIAIAILLDSGFPIIYKNERVGKNGTLFNVFKFRYLKLEYCTGTAYDTEGVAARAEADLIAKQNKRQGGLYKIVNDPRKTRVGTWLEKLSLDELPQLFNVLIGNMSLVGPRPHQEREVVQFPKNHQRVQTIKPGITGLAQISGRSDLDVAEELRLDTVYIENWSLLGDLYVILKTPFTLFKTRENS